MDIVPWGLLKWCWDFLGGSDGKASIYNAGDLGSIPGSGRFPGEGNSSPLQYSCLENPMDRGAWCRLLSMGVAKSQAQLNDFTFTFHFPALEKEMATHSRQEYWSGLLFPSPGNLPDPGIEPRSPTL